MTNAMIIFKQLTKQDMIHVVAFMEENKTCSLNDAINWLFEIIYVGGEDFVCEREHDLPYAQHMRQWRLDVCAMYNLGDIDDDEALPF